MYVFLASLRFIEWVLFLLMAFRREMGSSWKYAASHFNKSCLEIFALQACAFLLLFYQLTVTMISTNKGQFNYSNFEMPIPDLLWREAQQLPPSCKRSWYCSPCYGRPLAKMWTREQVFKCGIPHWKKTDYLVTGILVLALPKTAWSFNWNTFTKQRKSSLHKLWVWEGLNWRAQITFYIWALSSVHVEHTVCVHAFTCIDLHVCLYMYLHTHKDTYKSCVCAYESSQSVFPGFFLEGVGTG